MRRLRISHLIVQPVLVWDDGDELSPGPDCAPKPVPLTDLAALADRLRAEVGALQEQAALADPAGAPALDQS